MVSCFDQIKTQGIFLFPFLQNLELNNKVFGVGGEGNWLCVRHIVEAIHGET